MTNRLQIARLPRAFDPALGDEARAALPGLSGDYAALIQGAGGSSPYLKGLIERESGWLEGALDDPDAAVAALLEDCRALAPDQLKPGLRQAKRRIALITALADLAGAWPLERVTRLLTDFAGLACDLALKAEIAALIRRKKLPGMTEDDVATAAGLTVLAMGKMGAHELNYSSDIDLICLFDETRYDPDEYQEARHALVRVTRNMASALSEKTADGYVFRTDLRLRPDPSVTPVCISMAAAETYYESLGRTWERAAYIKARPCAGDLEAGARFAVSPGTTERLVRRADELGLPLLPGVSTASEVMRARDLGLRALKFFPAESVGGAKMLQRMGPVFPDVRFCPTGGITLANAPGYLALPSVSCVGGSWVVPRALLDMGDFGAIGKIAAETVGALRG